MAVNGFPIDSATRAGVITFAEAGAEAEARAGSKIRAKEIIWVKELIRAKAEAKWETQKSILLVIS